MVIKNRPPQYPRRGPSCLFVLFILFGIGVGAFVIVNADEVRNTIVPTPTPEPTRSAAEYALLADLSEADREYAEAIEFYETAVQLDPTRPEFYIRLIRLLVQENEAERAIEVAEQATLLAPDNDKVWTAAASAYLANGDRLADMGDSSGADLQYAQANQAAREAININAENATAYAYAAGGLVLQGDPEKYEQAQELADYAIFIDSGNPIAHYYMATVFTYLGSYTAALEQYQLGIEANPNMVDLYLGMAYNYYGTGSIPDAILTFERVLDIDPDNANAHDGLAHMRIQLGDYALAEESARQAVALNPNVARSHGRLGEAFYQQNNYPEAIRELETAVEMYGKPNGLNGRFFYFLAESYLRSGTDNCDKAIPLFEQVIDAAPAWEPFAREGIDECRLATFDS